MPLDRDGAARYQAGRLPMRSLGVTFLAILFLLVGSPAPFAADPLEPLAALVKTFRETRDYKERKSAAHAIRELLPKLSEPRPKPWQLMGQLRGDRIEDNPRELEVVAWTAWLFDRLLPAERDLFLNSGARDRVALPALWKLVDFVVSLREGTETEIRAREGVLTIYLLHILHRNAAKADFVNMRASALSPPMVMELSAQLGRLRPPIAWHGVLFRTLRETAIHWNAVEGLVSSEPLSGLAYNDDVLQLLKDALATTDNPELFRKAWRAALSLPPPPTKTVPVFPAQSQRFGAILETALFDSRLDPLEISAFFEHALIVSEKAGNTGVLRVLAKWPDADRFNPGQLDDIGTYLQGSENGVAVLTRMLNDPKTTMGSLTWEAKAVVARLCAVPGPAPGPEAPGSLVSDAPRAKSGLRELQETFARGRGAAGPSQESPGFKKARLERAPFGRTGRKARR